MKNFFACFCFALLGLSLVCASAQAEQGQYRSKVQITPEGEWSKGAELSIEELEQQMGSIEQAYAKSSAGRHLARHYVEQKQYAKAVEFYRESLAAEGLSDLANREMLRELAQVYLLQKDYTQAAVTLDQMLALDVVPDVTDYLLLARTQYHLGNYVAVVATLDRIPAEGMTLDTAQLKQALALYYRAGAFAQCEDLLQRLLEQEPGEAQHWHSLASVYLQQDKRRQALDQLALARDKAVPFSERDILLLADLYNANDNPYVAAETLQAALEGEEVAPSGAHYRKLFEFWLRAREQDRARAALEKAARMSGDIELYLYLAQLHMDQQDWSAMHRTMLDACDNQLADQYVGRANLMLGIGQLKTGDSAGARRSFINATLIGGVNAQAAEWLDFMEAAPITKDEARRIVGICYGSRDKRLASTASLPREAAQPEAAPAAQAADVPVAIKTVDAFSLFYSVYAGDLLKLSSEMRAQVVSLNVNLVKSGGSADGPLHIFLFRGEDAAPDSVELQLGMPARGVSGGRGRFRQRSAEAFKCAYSNFEGPPEGLLIALGELAQAAQSAGHEFTGEARLVIVEANSAEAIRAELQLGLK